MGGQGGEGGTCTTRCDVALLGPSMVIILQPRLFFWLQWFEGRWQNALRWRGQGTDIADGLKARGQGTDIADGLKARGQGTDIADGPIQPWLVEGLHACCTNPPQILKGHSPRRQFCELNIELCEVQKINKLGRSGRCISNSSLSFF